MTEQIRIGALCWNQYTDWPALLEAGRPRRPARLSTRSGRGTTSTRSSASSTGPIFEGWLTLAAWAQATERVRIGLMVGANTFREPALTAKMATTLDHISRRPGDPRHRRGVVRGGARGVRARVRERASRSGCAGSARRCRSCAGCSTASEPTATGAALHGEGRPQRPAAGPGAPAAAASAAAASRSRSSSSPATPTRTTSAAASTSVRRKEEILLQHCETVGRDPSEIERTTGIGTVVIRDDRAEAERRPRGDVRAQRRAPSAGRTSRSARRRTSPSGSRRTSTSATATSSPGFPAPYDEESMTRFATEVRPLLERSLS